MWAITEYWVQFPVPYSRLLAVTYFTYSSVYVADALTENGGIV